MNPLNGWERELRTWTPRRPRPSLEARLFGHRAEGEGEGEVPGRAALSWLAPAAACLLVFFVTFGPRPEGLGTADPGGVAGSVMAMGWSNASLAASLPCSLVGQNRVERSSFQSTRGPRSLSSYPSRPAWPTNRTVW